MSGLPTPPLHHGIDQDFARAIDSHQKGKLDRAARGYKRVLKTIPTHADALHLLGVIALQRGKPADATDLIQQALALNPAMAPAHYNLARCLRAQGDLDGALTHITRSLELVPADADAWLLRGQLLIDLDRSDAAIAAFSQALSAQPQLHAVRAMRAHLLFAAQQSDAAMADVDYLAAHAPAPHETVRNIAIMRVQDDDKDGALPILAKALALAPTDRQTRSLMAGVLIDVERNAEAMPILTQLLTETPDDIQLKLKMGILLANLKQFKKALPILEHVHHALPDDVRVLLKLAFTYQSLEMFTEAIDHYEKLKVLAPHEARSWSNLVGLYLELEEYDKALDEGMEALRVNPQVEQSYLNLAVLLQRFGDFDRAIDLYRRALEVNPDYVTAGSNLSHLLLAQGDIENGWDLYAHGFNAGLRRPMRRPNAELWRGQDIPDDTILVWKEQGIGDDVRFASCFADIIARAGRVIIETDPRLVALYQRSFPRAAVRAERTKTEMTFIGPPEMRFHTPAGQLPVSYRRTLEAFPAQDGYLTPDPQRVAFWRAKVEACGGGIRIGLAWRSMHQSATRNLVYTQLADWAALIATPGVTCINLQYDDPSEEIADLARTTGLTLHAMPGVDLKQELDEAAALTKACDLVVSAGTSVADMAAAVGTPVIFYGDARHAMQLGTDRFPWYPSARYMGREPQQPMSDIVNIITQDVQAFAQQYRDGAFS